MRNAHSLVRVLSLAVAFSGVACSGKSSSSSAAAASSTAAAPAPSGSAAPAATGSQSAAPSAAPHANKPPRKAPRNYAALQAELEKKCPVAKTSNTFDEKLALVDSIDCLNKKMNRDLDAILLPLKSSDPPKFKALMKEQAEWNRAMEKACALEEERMWVDFTTGQRDDGTYRSYTLLGCNSQAFTERTMYARTLASGKVAPLVKHIEEVQKNGAAVKAIVADIQSKSLVFQANPSAPDTGFSTPDWAAIIDECGHMIGATKTMAKSTCDAWPDLAKALGGAEKCLAKAELYYYVQGNNPSLDVSN